MTDEELIASYLKGDENSLALLFERYLTTIYRFVFYYVYDEDIATDVTQDVFVKVWKSLKKFDTEKSFKTWLYKIAKNTTLDCLKKKKITTFSELDGDNNIEDVIAGEELNASDIFIQNETREKIKELISILPLKDQDVIYLYYFEELSYEEVSGVLGETVNTVKSRGRRALQKIKQKLENENISM